jgi:hypothetical protein
MNETALLLSQARHLLQVSQGTLGEMLGSSRRTGQRWETKPSSVPLPTQLHKLARLVHPKDPMLAAKIAQAGESSLEALGLVLPTAARAVDPKYLVDTVVCSAADAMNVAPEAIRPALRAAFERARVTGLDVAEMTRLLGAKERRRGEG